MKTYQELLEELAKIIDAIPSGTDGFVAHEQPEWMMEKIRKQEELKEQRRKLAWEEAIKRGYLYFLISNSKPIRQR